MRKQAAIAVPVLCVLLLAGPAHAGTPLTKLGRGLTNVIFSPVEYFTNIQKAADRRGAASGLFEGLAAGTWYGVLRILSGVYDIATFLIPVPTHYDAIMKPDYVFTAAAQA